MAPRRSRCAALALVAATACCFGALNFVLPGAETEKATSVSVQTRASSSAARRDALVGAVVGSAALAVPSVANADGAAPGPQVEFTVNLGGDNPTTEKFTIQINPDWAPIGAAAFLKLTNEGFFDEAAIFRVVPGFIAQFGLPAKAVPRLPNLKDDPKKVSNKRGTIVFATAGPNTRTSQLFINYKDNAFLDGQGFTPFGEVLGDGMAVVEKFYKEYGEKPNQGTLTAQGNSYIDKSFPKISKFTTVKVKA